MSANERLLTLAELSDKVGEIDLALTKAHTVLIALSEGYFALTDNDSAMLSFYFTNAQTLKNIALDYVVKASTAVTELSEGIEKAAEADGKGSTDD